MNSSIEIYKEDKDLITKIRPDNVRINSFLADVIESYYNGEKGLKKDSILNYFLGSNDL